MVDGLFEKTRHLILRRHGTELFHIVLGKARRRTRPREVR
jgi:hypothetical protein